MSNRLATDRRLGWLAILGGSVLALAIQFVAPAGVPLYDGVVVSEPYRYLHPKGEQVGSPSSYAGSKPVTEAVSPLIAGFTSESPPQAQLIAQADAFRLTSGVTSLEVTIAPIDAPAPPDRSVIAGNVYRFAVTDQSGSPLATTPCDGCRSILLRAPGGTVDASLMRYVDGAWAGVETLHAGTVDLYQANVANLGDYAVVMGSTTPVPGDGTGGLALDPLILLGGGAVIVWLVILALVVRSRTRPEPIPGSVPDRGRGRIPSKRKPPRRPPPGRSS